MAVVRFVCLLARRGLAEPAKVFVPFFVSGEQKETRRDGCGSLRNDKNRASCFIIIIIISKMV